MSVSSTVNLGSGACLERKMLELLTTFHLLCQLETRHPSSVPYMMGPPRKLLNRHSDNLVFTAG